MEDTLAGTYNPSQMKALTAGLDGQEVVLIQVTFVIPASLIHPVSTC